MYARDCLRAGDHMMVVPLGLPMTLEYNDSGNLVKVYKGWDGNREDRTDTSLEVFRSTGIVPLRIGMRTGTSWVKGVIYTSTNFVTENTSNHSVQDIMIHAFEGKKTQFNFFAGNIESTGTAIAGAEPNHRQLAMEGFNTLPMYMVSRAPVTASLFDSMVNKPDYPFKYPLIMALFIYRGKDLIIADNELKQYVIRRVIKDVDDNGYINATLLTTDKNLRIKISFTDVIDYNLNPGVLIVVDQGGRVIYSTEVDGKHHDPRVRYIDCSICGKRVVAPNDGSDMICSNKHCRSRMFPVFNHFLNELGLAVLPPALYKTYIKQGELLCLPDVFELPEYRNMRLKCSIAKVLRAIVPLTEIPSSEVFTVFASLCHNSINQVQYQIEHAEDMWADLKLDQQSPELRHSFTLFIQWLSDLANVSDTMSLLNCPQIEIVDTDKKFDGPAIFRNKHIFITGKFSHGSLADISAILKSYSAEVSLVYDESVNGVLLGDIPENVNGGAVRTAKSKGLPVMVESDFFKEYGIDQDLANLVSH